jgi:hypothetical protein
VTPPSTSSPTAASKHRRAGAAYSTDKPPSCPEAHGDDPHVADVAMAAAKLRGPSQRRWFTWSTAAVLPRCSRRRFPHRRCRYGRRPSSAALASAVGSPTPGRILCRPRTAMTTCDRNPCSTPSLERCWFSWSHPLPTTDGDDHLRPEPLLHAFSRALLVLLVASFADHGRR